MADNTNDKGLLGVFQGAVDSVKTTVQGIKLPEINISGLFQGNKEKEDNTADKIKAVPVRNAVKIIYYMMAADGEIYQKEEEKFDEIGRELDPDFASYREEIIGGCRAQMEKIIDAEDQYAVLQDGVEEALASKADIKGAVITPKVLVWDLMTVAYSDGSYDEKERRLLKYVVRKLNIDKDIFLEMESSFLTLMDLENELAWIKTTDRPYLTIEAMVNEIADRKTAVMESIKDLIAF